jgi:hypothetical protein
MVRLESLAGSLSPRPCSGSFDDEGTRATTCFLTFFTATIDNANTARA